MDNRPPDRQDLDTLLDHLIGFAQQTLGRYGEFYPFGAVLTTNGEIVGQAGKLVETDRPPSQPIIELIVKWDEGSGGSRHDSRIGPLLRRQVADA